MSRILDNYNLVTIPSVGYDFAPLATQKQYVGVAPRKLR